METSKNPYQQYLSLSEAAKLTPYSQEYLSLRARQGKLKAVKMGSDWFTTRAWLHEYLKKVAADGELPTGESLIGRRPIAPRTLLTSPLLFVWIALSGLFIASNIPVLQDGMPTFTWLNQREAETSPPIAAGTWGSPEEDPQVAVLDKIQHLSSKPIPVSPPESEGAVAGTNDSTIAGNLTVDGAANIKGSLTTGKPSFIVDLGLSGNVQNFAGGGPEGGNQPQINFNQGASRILDDGQLHIRTDDDLHLDAPRHVRIQSGLCLSGECRTTWPTGGGSGGGSSTLQGVYEAGNTITTSNNRNILFTLADTTTDSDFLVDLLGTGNTIEFRDTGTAFATFSDTGTALFRNTTNSTTAFRVQNAAGTTTVFDVDTTNARVGIGTAAPGVPLHIVSTVQPQVRIEGSGASGGMLELNHSGNFHQLYVNGPDMKIWNGTRDALILAGAAGDVGVDIAAPAAKLHVNSAGTNALFRVTDATATAVDVLNIADEGATTFRNRTDSTTAFNVQNAAGTIIFDVNTTSGGVGIGTTDPQRALHIETNAAGLTRGARVQNINTGSGSCAQWEAFNDATSGGSLQLGTCSAGSGAPFDNRPHVFAGGTSVGLGLFSAAAGSDIRFYTGGSATSNERARIDSAGLFGIGTTSIGAQLHVTAGAAGTIGQIVRGAASQTANLQEWQNSAATVLASVSASGGLSAATLNVGTGTTITQHLSGTATLNFAAPGAVPGCSADLTITVTGAALGDTVTLGTPVTLPASFMVNAWVSAANTVSIRWCQLAGAAADPDGGAGGTYRVDVWRH